MTAGDIDTNANIIDSCAGDDGANERSNQKKENDR